MPGWLDRWTEKRTEKARRIIAEAEAAGHPTAAPDLREMFGQVKERIYDAVGDMFDDRAGVIDPRGADFKRPPPELVDPAERAAAAAAERGARDAARAPYRGPTPPAVAFTRLSTTGEEQLGAVASVLAGFAPDRVYGVYRVPHRYEERRKDERRTYLEWEIAHAPDADAGTHPQPPSVELTGFSRADHWARRGYGDPAVLDEDVAGALVARAGLRPEDCFGVTRLWSVLSRDGEDGRTQSALVEGALVVARPGGLAAQQAMLADLPLDVGPPGFHVTTLDWEAVAAWNAPKRWKPPRVPAPLPHLPGSPQELLLAYLEIVGVRPADCYGAQVTRTTDQGLGDLGVPGVSRGRRDPEHLCADGTSRPRLDAAEDVVIAYRDAPEYAEGRRRWAAYEDEVLCARLSHRTDVRPPMTPTPSHDDPFLLEVLNLFNPLDPLPVGPRIRNRGRQPQLGPYCDELAAG